MRQCTCDAKSTHAPTARGLANVAARTEPGASFSSSSSSDTAHGDAIFDARHTQGTYSHSYLMTTPKGSLEARVRQSSGWAKAVNTLRQHAGVRSAHARCLTSDHRAKIPSKQRRGYCFSEIILGIFACFGLRRLSLDHRLLLLLARVSAAGQQQGDSAGPLSATVFVSGPCSVCEWFT